MVSDESNAILWALKSVLAVNKGEPFESVPQLPRSIVRFVASMVAL